MARKITVKSRTSGAHYDVYDPGTTKQFCTCPAFKFQRKANADRKACKHLKAIVAGQAFVDLNDLMLTV